MVYAEEEQDKVEKTNQRPADALFEGVSEKELIDVYKTDKKEIEDEKKRKTKKEGSSVIEEQHFFQERKG